MLVVVSDWALRRRDDNLIQGPNNPTRDSFDHQMSTDFGKLSNPIATSHLDQSISLDMSLSVLRQSL
jgi:hypothetical protein